ncbi:MAG: L-threonylcarbamoyladenylate synthase [Chloroflexota bacterium]|nr:L-threonylcarbamoyladenylate synthase [Chloroflexota bacterium]|tara:strand:- start:616 stop:1248 length:633 start_codon:yes stop_codon:yes gene_type:complete
MCLNSKYKIELEEAASELNLGKIITIPTDTFYGLACDATNLKTVKSLFKIKERELNKPVPVLIADIKDLYKFISPSNTVDKLISKFWPGPLTLILETDFDFPEGTVKDNGWVGFRIPDLKFTRDLIRIIGKPLTGTSANISNFPETKDLDVLKSNLKEKNIGKFVNINCGSENMPSTVLKIDMNKIKIIREGPITKSLIKSTLGDDFKYE